MNYKFGKTIVVALGGSIVHPDKIDVRFLKNFRKFILKWVGRGKKFVVVVGGGSVAREYQKAASAVISLSNEDKDWIGIHATRLNAHLLRTIFRKESDPVVCDSRAKVRDSRFTLHASRFKILVASGWRPGWSTDYVAFQIAADVGAKEAVIAGKPDFVYPVRSNVPRGGTASNGVDESYLDKKHPFYNLSWQEYRKLVPSKWIPGSHAPVDPVGARLAGGLPRRQAGRKLAAIVIKGTNLKNFDHLLAGKDFNGTIIE